MSVSTPRPRYSLRWQTARDWPLAGAAISAFLSFVMLFPPWLEGGGESENAFGNELQSAGPALIIVMVIATITCLGLAVATTERRYLIAALLSSSNLLVIYVVKVADVSDLTDLYSKLAASLSGGSVGTGAGLWLGFVFAVLTLLFNGTGSTLHFEVTIDGRQEYAEEITLGRSQDLDLDVHDALRLKLTVTYSGQDLGSYYGSWGNARLVS